MPTPSRLASRTATSTIPLLAPDRLLPKLVATLEAGNPRISPGWAQGYQLYRSQGPSWT